MGLLQSDWAVPSREITPTREHLTFFNPWRLAQKSAVERGLLLPLVRAPRIIPVQILEPDGALVNFLRQFDPGMLPMLGLDGSCVIARGSELWQRASWAVVAHDRPTTKGIVPGFEQTPAAGERCALLLACLASKAADRPVKLLIDNQAVVLRLQRGINFGMWSGDCLSFWSTIQALIVPGTTCAWIPSHDKQKEWRPPVGWPDFNHCRALNKRADAAAGSVSASFQEDISAALVQHHSAVSWAAAAFKAQKENTQPFWQVLLDHAPARGRNEE